MEVYGKSFKMWVNEICVKQMVQPQWAVREMIPGQSPPTFICRCTISYTNKTLTGEAIGKTKKEAEQEAAKVMLYDKLKMTPAQLLQMSHIALKKEKTVSPNIGQQGDDNGDVSDTDDKEMASVDNPIGELLSICLLNEGTFIEPQYDEVNVEGPSHKRVFTMRCKVSDSISLEGRRFKKQIAKKVAAFRVLRQIKNQGFTCTPFTPKKNEEEMEESETGLVNRGESRKSIQNYSPKISPIELQVEEISAHFNKKVATNETTAGGFLVPRHGRLFCNSNVSECTSRLMNYSHIFQHLKESSTMDGVLMTPDALQVIRDNGGSVALLKAIGDELGISLRFLKCNNVPDTGNNLQWLLLFMKFPFIGNLLAPTTLTVQGEGTSLLQAKANAALEALKLLQRYLYH